MDMDVDVEMKRLRSDINHRDSDIICQNHATSDLSSLSMRILCMMCTKIYMEIEGHRRTDLTDGPVSNSNQMQ